MNNFFQIYKDLIIKNKFVRLNKKIFNHNFERLQSNLKFYGLHNSHFTNYNCKHHKFMLGFESLIDCLLLSETKYKVFTDSNVWRISSLVSNKTS